ncbi:unnamed protein product [Choristocarpus tenellus]
MFKVGVLFTTLFLFFTTTTLVSVTLRETQVCLCLSDCVCMLLWLRIIDFLAELGIEVYVCVYVVGILFFLFEFFSDQLLAFMVLSVVWLCEVYSVVSVRTTMCIRFFPQAS